MKNKYKNQNERREIEMLYKDSLERDYLGGDILEEVKTLI